jgi:protein-L-isoaspartate(D-aspartate) O-methyltransferase
MDKPLRFSKSADHPGDRKTPRWPDLGREGMIELLRQRGIRNERLLRAMSVVDRRLFLPEPFANRAYDDSALPIGHAQTISQPYTVAFMTECLDVREGQKVLEVGTGSGYQSAILAEMGARVFSIERHMALLTEARRTLEQLGYGIASKCGDGTIGWKEFSPFEGILVTAGAPDVPQPLLEQLSDGGRMVIPIGDLDVQNLHVVSRVKDRYETRVVSGFKFVPLIGKKGWK